MTTLVSSLQLLTNKYFSLAGGLWFLLGQFWKDVLTFKIEKKLLKDQIYQVGVRSLLLVLVTALCSGMVMALQFGLGLQKFGGQLYVPKIVSLSFIRELAPVFTALVVAGRVGAGYASEIGSMVVTQQVDAIRALGTSPITKILVPRVLALAICLPILTTFAIIVGIWGSLLVGSLELNLDGGFYYQKATEILILPDLVMALTKSVFFAFVISICSCHFGLRVTGGTQGVGIATTRAVVVSTILLFVVNFLITKIFWMLLK
jgi:phospholipid/cholesterol/gamma-HCH transport system permease protein